MSQAIPITVTITTVSSNHQSPPKVPPRTKKRASKDTEDILSLEELKLQRETFKTDLSSLLSKEPTNPKHHLLNKSIKSNERQMIETKRLMEHEYLRSINPKREILIAATKNGREKRPETRQREPAMLIRPDPSLVNTESSQEQSRYKIMNGSPIKYQQTNQNDSVNQNHLVFVKPTTGIHLIPALAPVSYGKWLEKSGAGDPEINTRLLRKFFGHGNSNKANKAIGSGGFKAVNSPTIMKPTSPNLLSVSSAKFNKQVVSRSGSLSSQYSSCSDSGNEGQPKSVLKKSKKNRGDKPKKSVTFNAMTTVQVMV